MGQRLSKYGKPMRCDCVDPVAQPCRFCRKREAQAAYFQRNKARIVAAWKAKGVYTTEKYRAWRREYYKRKGLAKYGREHYAENRSAVRLRKNSTKHGLSREEFVALLSRGRCDICGTDDPGHKYGWQIDHDHKTWRVRGLLCAACNSNLLPVVEQKSDLIDRARRYLANPPGVYPLRAVGAA